MRTSDAEVPKNRIHHKDLHLLLRGPVYDGSNTAHLAVIDPPDGQFLPRQGRKPDQTGGCRRLACAAPAEGDARVDRAEVTLNAGLRVVATAVRARAPRRRRAIGPGIRPAICRGASRRRARPRWRSA